jgi:lipopolysaccharide export system permease protein
MVILGITLSVNTAKRGLTKRFGVSLLLAFCYFILLRFGLILGENGGLDPGLGAWLGNIVFGSIALTLYLNMGRA